MGKEIISGKELLDNFFNEIENMPKIDKKIASILKNLYLNNKFTDRNISNALLELRKEIGNDQD